MPTKALFCSLVLAALTVTGFADPHFFPRLRPLFIDLNEAKVPAAAQNALAQAKSDFQRARHHEAPRYATYAGLSESPRGRVYRGHGYSVTVVHDETPFGWYEGPKIELDASLTGGAPYRYSEVDVIKE